MTIYDKYTPDQIQRGLDRLMADVVLLNTDTGPTADNPYLKMARDKLARISDQRRAYLMTPQESDALTEYLGRLEAFCKGEAAAFSLAMEEAV